MPDQLHTVRPYLITRERLLADLSPVQRTIQVWEWERERASQPSTSDPLAVPSPRCEPPSVQQARQQAREKMQLDIEQAMRERTLAMSEHTNRKIEQAMTGTHDLDDEWFR